MESPDEARGPSIRELSVPLDRDRFLRELIRQLAGVLEEVVGLEETRGFISLVGQAIGDQIGEDYRKALAQPSLAMSQLGEVLVDLKRRIGGDFFIVEADEAKIVLGNRACPFGDHVIGRPSMCMMTSNVFGSIVATNLGYARVEIQEAIARGDPGCRVVVHLKEGVEAGFLEGREYYGSEARP